MTYMIDQADRVASQLEKFSTGYAHHVVGQHANLEFWLGEAKHALDALDGYRERFERMASAQKGWVEAHNTQVGSFCPTCGGACELEAKMTKPPGPTRIPHASVAQATQRLKDGAYRFLRRCYRMGLIDEPEFRSACDRLDTGVDLVDLKRT